MTVEEVVRDRGIEEVLHFTTNRGLVGVCDSGYIKSRDRLEESDRLKHIFSPNAERRKDPSWTDHVSLSIERINYQFFEIASGRWHRDKDLWWCILSLNSSILSHEGVHFVTTNNIYTGASRKRGGEGLEALFAASILQQRRYVGSNKIVHRPDDLSESIPTCPQAEVLYPRQIPIEYLERIYCETGEDADWASATLETFNLREIDVVVEPGRFSRNE